MHVPIEDNFIHQRILGEEGILLIPVVENGKILQASSVFLMSYKRLEEPNFRSIAKCVDYTRNPMVVQKIFNSQEQHGSGFMVFVDRVNFQIITGDASPSKQDFFGTWATASEISEMSVKKDIAGLITNLIHQSLESYSLPCLFNYIPIKSEQGFVLVSALFMVRSAIAKGIEFPIAPSLPLQL
jgi:hypothetical protein